MKLFLQILGGLLLAAFLTLATQVGAIVVLLWWPIRLLLRRTLKRVKYAKWIRAGAFMVWWCLCSLVIIPLLAPPLSGREAMPVWSNPHLKPQHIGYALLNRHYVRPQLKTLLEESAAALDKKYPGTVTAYLDCCFPFRNGYPLLPHLSHNDGKKADLAFFFKDAESDEYLPLKARTVIAYGGSVPPRANEYNQPAACAKKGYSQYSAMCKYFPQIESRAFDAERTREMLRILARHPNTGKLLLEPHIKSRLRLGSYHNIRFHGCKAVRHDDHVHVQL
ncbi:MAG: hypothetical protein AAF927_09975 [Bacteroidota bacterium]